VPRRRSNAEHFGNATHVLTFSLDITPLKRVQQQLGESEQLRASIVEHSLEGFVTVSGDGRIVEFNPAAEQVFGYARAEALGKPIGDLRVRRCRRARRPGTFRSAPA
jgi:PAS domain-containing protein